jgi:FkbM family methyltransferase
MYYIPPEPQKNARWFNLKKALAHARMNRCGFFRCCLVAAFELLDYVKYYTFALFVKTPVMRFLKKDSTTGRRYFDFCGAKLPDVRDKPEIMTVLPGVFEDVFLVPCFYGDNHDKHIVKALDWCMGEGPYGYTDGAFDVTVRAGDVVIDAGAWIGDFSAYAAAKGARAFAFEPCEATFQILTQTAALNGGDAIIPAQKGLGSRTARLPLFVHTGNSAANSAVLQDAGRRESGEYIDITTLDAFVAERNLTRVDFIKADIEGAARVLREFAPKLALCTYHLPDDPQVLEALIREINPRYTVVHLRHKLFAAVRGEALSAAPLD